MAFFNTSFHSDKLGKACTMNVIVPQRVSTQIGLNSSGGRRTYPVLYLLHGLSDDYSIWERRTSIERYAASMDLVIVMPDGGRSFYADMATGAKYWSFLSEELPEIVAGFFPVSTRREDTFAAGLSMGGYGALKLGLRRPDRFAACAAMSAVTDISRFIHEFMHDPEANGFFGPEKIVPDDCDLFKLAEKAAQLPPGERPQVMQRCGTDDFLYKDNIAFREQMEKLNAFDYTYAEGPGTHCWDFWDEHIQKILKWLPLQA